MASYTRTQGLWLQVLIIIFSPLHLYNVVATVMFMSSKCYLWSSYYSVNEKKLQKNIILIWNLCFLSYLFGSNIILSRSWIHFLIFPWTSLHNLPKTQEGVYRASAKITPHFHRLRFKPTFHTHDLVDSLEQLHEYRKMLCSFCLPYRFCFHIKMNDILNNIKCLKVRPFDKQTKRPLVKTFVKRMVSIT